MPYKIEWIGTVALGISTEGGRPLEFALEGGQQVPNEFKVGDSVKIVNCPEHPSVIAMGMENEVITNSRTFRPAQFFVLCIGTTCTKLRRNNMSIESTC